MSVLARMHGQVWAISPEALEALASVDIAEAAAQGWGPETEATDRPYGFAAPGVALVKVQGVLVPQPSFWGMLFGGETSYASIRDAVEMADADPAVACIVLQIASPGGLVEGAASTAQAIHDTAKPVTAYVTGQALSAAYWLASAADRIVASPTADAGSLGVCVSVVDCSAAERRQGVARVDFVSSLSPRKNANPLEDEAAANDLQQLVDDKALVFLGDVARFRGLADADAVAEAYGGGAVIAAGRAVGMGLIDAVARDMPLSPAHQPENTDPAAAGMEDGLNIKRNGPRADADTGAGEAGEDVVDEPTAAEGEEIEDERDARIATLEEENEKLREQIESMDHDDEDDEDEAAALATRIADLEAKNAELEDGARIERAQSAGKLGCDGASVSKALRLLANDRKHGSAFFAEHVEGLKAGSVVPVGPRVSHGGQPPAPASDEVGARRQVQALAKENGVSFAAQMTALRHSEDPAEQDLAAALDSPQRKGA